MTASASPRVTAYAWLAAVLLGALAPRRPELAILALLFALPPALGLRLARAPEIRVEVEPERTTAIEGEELELELTVSSPTPVERLEIVLVLPAGLEVLSGERGRCGSAGTTSGTLPLRLRWRWGNYDLGDVRLQRARDRLGLLVWEEAVDRRQRIRVYPTSRRRCGESSARS